MPQSKSSSLVALAVDKVLELDIRERDLKWLVVDLREFVERYCRNDEV